ncbi:FMN-binding negative transcriptional regulator [Candidatus Poribacteria bacterium]|mgnify:FL=1|jgi:transcriptional regulator|nr:FMN-binding negative transcriptional regulator [Candidatus Poribacteria bacterium]MBT5535747.1 FMN-binding negative transcriptional regulator [Candidatus Poribacteria bacterium]MBT5710504.1 FMN-binding negative transcriptional regulator [Candidatus Poribacteria bacterium]MBT7100022.1 FMN-binding negative transcriptional regulator [Candidatus Poribacteria bacterium]MBT7806528.1 FMN-binding negative transcriptional regulator [Candidatus Poribacteria bacterium]
MYIPATNRVDDRAKLVAFMREHSFATVITPADGQTLVTHIPVLIDDSSEVICIRGHFARANPHSDGLDTGRETTVVFQGPHAYVSPSLYDAREAVPTWNYIAVHASGAARTLDPHASRGVLEESIATFEAAYRAQWDSLDEAYRDGLAKAIVAFEIDVTRLDGKYKLSQNRSPAEQDRIAESLVASQNTNVAAVGDAMRDRPRRPG